MSLRMIKYILIIIFCLISQWSFCQTKVIVVKDQSGNSIEFVNVYAQNSNFGTISDENGKVEISLEKIVVSDTIQFTCIGYADKRIAKVDFENIDIDEITLEDKSYILDEFSVISSKIKYKKKKVGIKAKLDLFQIGIYANRDNAGVERGIVMNNHRECYIESINFNLIRAFHDSMLYEINLYRYEDEVLENINKERIFLLVNKNESAHQINIRDQNIKVSGDFLVSFEAVQVREDIWAVFFKGAFRSRSKYLEKSKDGVWTILDEIAVPAVWCELQCARKF